MITSKELIKGVFILDLIYKELKKLVDDYDRCETSKTRELILEDIMLLSEALCEQNSTKNEPKIRIKT